MAKYGVQNAVVLDSDAVLFCDIQEIFELVPTQFQFACSKAGGPALTVIRRSIEPLLDHILARYASSEYLNEACERSKAAKSAGRMDNLTDMTFCEEFTREHPLGYVYLNHTEFGHLDHGIYLPDGMKSRKVGRRQRKRIVWNADGPTLLPYFLKEADGSLVRALVIHFQSKGKRMISNFNPVRESIWSSSLGLSIRSFLFNFRMN